jgi:hypothetical protein
MLVGEQLEDPALHVPDTVVFGIDFKALTDWIKTGGDHSTSTGFFDFHRAQAAGAKGL